MEATADWLNRSRRRMLSWLNDDVFRRLLVNASKLLSANVAAGVLGLIAVLVTASALGPREYGILSLVLVYSFMLSNLVTFQAWQAIIKFGSEAIQSNNRPALLQLVKLGFGLDIFSAMFGTFLAIVFAGPMIRLLGWDPSVREYLIMYSVLCLFSFSGTPTGILRLFDRFDLLSQSAVFGAVVRLCGVAWCIVTEQGLFGFVLAYLVTGIIGQLCLLFASLWVIRQEGLGGFARQPLGGVRSNFVGIWDFVWTTNASSTIRTISRGADELIVAAFATPAALGMFTIAKRFAEVFPRLLDPLYQAIYPELTRLWASNQKRAFLSVMRRTTFLVSTVAVSSWLGFLLCGRWLIVSTAGPEYAQVYLVSVIYMLALVIALCGFSMTPSILAIGLPRKSFAAISISTVLYLAVLAPLVWAFGIVGASISYVIFYLTWALIMIVHLRPYLLSCSLPSKENVL